MTVSSVPAKESNHLRRWKKMLTGIRIRMLAASVLLLMVSALVSIVAIRTALIVRLENRVEAELEQEAFEFNRLVTDGVDPRTGRSFTSLHDVFAVFFARNVPSYEEALLGFIGPDLYRQSANNFRLSPLPQSVLTEFTLSTRPSGPVAMGEVDTDAGPVHFLAVPVEVGGEQGTFVVAVLPVGELAEIADYQFYGSAAAIGVLLLALVSAWLVWGRVLAPVRRLTHTAGLISRSDLTSRIPAEGRGEAAEMARSFNAMLDRLERVLRAEREFVRDASHELRVPLTVCIGHLGLLNQADSAPQATISLVTEELERMARMVDDLRVLAESGHPDFLELEPIDLEVFAHDLAVKVSPLAAREWQVDSTAEGHLVADRQRLTEAVMNLAQNAAQHTGLGDTIAIGTAVDNGEVRIWVRDTGLGVPVADQSRVFDRFRRGSQAYRRYRGAGLGLAMVKVIAEAHCGRVQLDSRSAAGATFTIVVPRSPGKEAENGAHPHG